MQRSPSPTHEPTRTERDKVATMIRSWREEYDGPGDPAEFISRTEELAEPYGIAGAMVILLRGCAMDWNEEYDEPIDFDADEENNVAAQCYQMLDGTLSVKICSNF